MLRLLAVVASNNAVASTPAIVGLRMTGLDSDTAIPPAAYPEYAASLVASAAIVEADVGLNAGS